MTRGEAGWENAGQVGSHRIRDSVFTPQGMRGAFRSQGREGVLSKASLHLFTKLQNICVRWGEGGIWELSGILEMMTMTGHCSLQRGIATDWKAKFSLPSEMGNVRSLSRKECLAASSNVNDNGGGRRCMKTFLLILNHASAATHCNTTLWLAGSKDAKGHVSYSLFQVEIYNFY